jgi:hypothetical protein
VSAPVNTEKDLDDWSFDDLCKWACWQVVESMTAGKPLRSAISSILTVARQWNPPKVK